MNPEIDLYLKDGCGRCPLKASPECKVNFWQDELKALRRILLSCGLTEELKWGVPCYTHKTKNVIVISALKDCCTISFFKGQLMGDPEKILEKPGENTQAARIIRFTSLSQVLTVEDILKAYIFEAIEIENSGVKIKMEKRPEPIPSELEETFKNNSELKEAFYSLTPGRQRGYILYFSQPKNSTTRISRIEKYTEKILNGLGFHDR